VFCLFVCLFGFRTVLDESIPDGLEMLICLFVCLFVGIKPEKLYSASFVWREVKPLGVIAHGLRHFYVRETKTAAQTTYLSIDG